VINSLPAIMFRDRRTDPARYARPTGSTNVTLVIGFVAISCLARLIRGSYCSKGSVR
jgi:hypothetical protein